MLTKIFSRLVLSFVLSMFCTNLLVFAQTENPPIVESTETDQAAIEKWLNYIRQIVEESVINQQRANWRQNYEYTFNLRETVSDRKARSETRVFEMFMPNRMKRKNNTKAVTILIEKDGVPIAPEKIEKERREAAEKLVDAESKSEKETISTEKLREGGMTFFYEWQGISVAIDNYITHCPLQGRTATIETLNGRKTLAINLTDCNPVGLHENFAYIERLEGKIWFDLTDKAPVRFEAWAKQPAVKTSANSKPQPAIIIEQTKIAENLWFPSVIKIEGVSNEILFPGLKANLNLQFFDYKPSQTEIKDYKVGEREKQ